MDVIGQHLAVQINNVKCSVDNPLHLLRAPNGAFSLPLLNMNGQIRTLSLLRIVSKTKE